jgi:hypothetical protein
MADSNIWQRSRRGRLRPVRKAPPLYRAGANGKRALQTGTNGFTCVVLGDTSLFADHSSLMWMRAIATHRSRRRWLNVYHERGLVRQQHRPICAGTGASKSLGEDLTTRSDLWTRREDHGISRHRRRGSDETYVVWPDTPYAHLMIPLTIQAAAWKESRT